ncbi:MAG: thiamine pyrophosphate-dependent dehydrogenase E1 component subunit alpha [Bryobacteraceae bacterium]|nr:thiamine pyrophosphate-dependent dehydrogenase E1 component subunit alpha [Bryobacteraceae bacterium]MDW8378635.1 thiamine pyrophosphate-dependent dehydrogenase E1 component subunit alpha [Bryobacterales bacterium]
MPVAKPEPARKNAFQSTDAELSRKFLYYMALMREVEERIERRLYRQGKVLGGVYVGRGQEAIPVGSGLAARPDDIFFPSHRDLALYFIRGVTPKQVFAQYMGRRDGLTQGRDGNMHMGDLSKGLVAIISAMAASVPVAAGAAMALKYQGKDSVVFVYFGDGATSRGDWHEGINLATVQKAPLVLVCNNNQYAYSTPLDKQMACANVADRAPGYGMPAEIVDGNDVWAIYEAAKRAAAHARAGLGPYLIECKTFRMTGHSAHDPADYVPKDLFQKWSQRCPIQQLEKRMLDNSWASRQEIDALHQQIKQEVDQAIEQAEQSPYPDPSELLLRVYENEA